MGELRLVQTCGACPEQYDVFDGGDQVGYLRLRHGYFYAATPNVGGVVVYDADTIGDGAFDPSERDLHIESALHAISEYRRRARSLAERGEGEG